MHRAEEALLIYESIDLVLADGLSDEGRLAGSTIPPRDDLLNRARRALITLSPTSSSYLLPSTVPAAATTKGETTLPSPTGGVGAEVQARVMLRHVRFSINDFRDTRRARLVQARTRLLATMVFTGLATCLLLLFTIIGHPPPDVLLTAAALYAIGAVVGLFNRLYSDFGTRTHSLVDDYGLSTIRLFQTSLLSGLAALAGVYIAVALPIALNDPVLRAEVPAMSTATVVPTVVVTAMGTTTVMPTATATPTAQHARASGVGTSQPLHTTSATATTTVLSTAAPAAPGPEVQVPRPGDVYNIDRYPFGVVLAAIFGLTPGLLITRLSQGIEQAKNDLQRSEPSGQAQP